MSASKYKSRTVNFIVPMVVDQRQHDGRERKQTPPKKVTASSITIEGRYITKVKPVIDKMMRKKDSSQLDDVAWS